jgi:predicted aspartyl protease
MRQEACVLIGVTVSLCSLVPLQGSQPPANVPFELVQQHLVVAKGAVAGLHDLNLLIDTGSIPSVLDQRIARKLQLDAAAGRVVAFGQEARSSIATVSGLRIGPFQPGDVPAAIGNLSYLEGARIDVVVGLDVLVKTSFAIDYAARQLSFSPPERESGRAPLQIIPPFLTVRLIVAGQPMQLLVDTGSRDLVLFKSRMPQALLPLPWKGEKIVQHSSGEAHLLRYELRHVTLGTEGWDSMHGFVLDASTNGYPAGIDGVLGVLALGGTRVHFDFERGELGWSRRPGSS